MSRENLGLLDFIGVCVFAGTLPFTRLAVEHLSPGFVIAGRASISGLLAGAILLLRRPWPDAGSRAKSSCCKPASPWRLRHRPTARASIR